MSKAIETVLLNEIQMATFKVLRKKAVDGVIHSDFAATFKQNVINALVRHGAIKPTHGKHYRFTDVLIARKPEHVARTPKTVDVVADDTEMQIAA
jgi:hypothetical protein